jgi:hypothetical protein
MRLYFNLVRGPAVILDEEGIDVPNLSAALNEAVELLREIRRTDASAGSDWAGWKIEVIDATGAVLGSIDLDPIRSDPIWLSSSPS